MSYSNAIKAGALAFFDEKYDDDVRVLNINQVNGIMWWDSC